MDMVIKFCGFILQIIILYPKFVCRNKRARKVLKIKKYKDEEL